MLRGHQRHAVWQELITAGGVAPRSYLLVSNFQIGHPVLVAKDAPAALDYCGSGDVVLCDDGPPVFRSKRRHLRSSASELVVW